jgi:hypothetical protein
MTPSRLTMFGGVWSCSRNLRTMALPRRLAITTHLTGHPGSRNATPWDRPSSLSLRRRSFSSDSISESDAPPDIWILLEDLDLYLYEKETDLDTIILLVEETLGISLSLVSTSTWLLDPSGAQSRVKKSSNNSLETSSGCVQLIEACLSCRCSCTLSAGTLIRFLVYIRRPLIPHSSHCLL